MVAIAVLMALLFSKNVYTASLSSYYTFYLIQKFHLSVQNAQIHLFVFLAAVVAGTLAGGAIGDRFGRKPVIWFSILGAFPFALMLPYATLFWTGVLSVLIGLILASAFSAILIYAQDLLPGRVGMVAGMFYGFSFGLAGQQDLAGSGCMKRRVSAGPVTTHPGSVRIGDRQNTVPFENLQCRGLANGSRQRLELRHADGAQIKRLLGVPAQSDDGQTQAILARIIVLLYKSALLEGGEQPRRGGLMKAKAARKLGDSCLSLRLSKCDQE